MIKFALIIKKHRKNITIISIALICVAITTFSLNKIFNQNKTSNNESKPIENSYASAAKQDNKTDEKTPDNKTDEKIQDNKNTTNQGTKNSVNTSTSTSVSGTASTSVKANKSAPTTPTPTQAVSEKLITVGTAKDEVIRIMGNPRSIDTGRDLLYSYHYGSATLFLFDTDKGVNVVGWYNIGGILKVTLGNKLQSASPFTLGSSKEDVIKAMGTPYILEPFYATLGQSPKWTYNLDSMVIFDNNYKVKEYKNNGNLKVSLGTINPSAPPITIGSTLQEVINAMGTPNAVTANSNNGEPFMLIYGNSAVYLKGGKVTNWENAGNLKVK